MFGLENRALTRFESEVTPPPHLYSALQVLKL